MKITDKLIAAVFYILLFPIVLAIGVIMNFAFRDPDVKVSFVERMQLLFAWPWFLEFDDFEGMGMC